MYIYMLASEGIIGSIQEIITKNVYKIRSWNIQRKTDNTVHLLLSVSVRLSLSVPVPVLLPLPVMLLLVLTVVKKSGPIQPHSKQVRSG